MVFKFFKQEGNPVYNNSISNLLDYYVHVSISYNLVCFTFLGPMVFQLQVIGSTVFLTISLIVIANLTEMWLEAFVMYRNIDQKDSSFLSIIPLTINVQEHIDICCPMLPCNPSGLPMPQGQRKTFDYHVRWPQLSLDLLEPSSNTEFLDKHSA